jgi:hypothetical protein
MSTDWRCYLKTHEFFATLRFRILATIRLSAVVSAFFIFAYSSMIVDAQEAKLSALLKRSPAPANAMGYINVPALKQLMADAELPSNLTDNVVDIWFLSDLDTVSLTPRWEAGYATLKKELQADELAKGLKGYIDTVGDKQVVWTPKQSYLVPLDASRIGFIRPAKRNLLSSWLNSTDTGIASDYLSEQAKQPEPYLSLMVAIDLQDSFSPVALTGRLGTFESLKSLDVKSAANVLASVKGMSIIVGRRSLKECIISIDFAQSPASLLPVANPLLNEILNRNGTAAPEVTMWQPKVDGNKLTFQGPISAESLEGVLGIFSIQTHAESVVDSMKPKGESQPAGSSGAYVSESKTYFGKVNAYIERVRKYSAQTTGYRAKWNDQQARHIDELGTLNVDPQVIDYGSNVSNLLRNNALTIRSGNIAAGQVKAVQGLSQVRSGYAGYDGFSYYYDPNTSVDYQSVTDIQASGAAYSDYRTTLSSIDKLTEQTRKAMTAKYNLQF